MKMLLHVLFPGKLDPQAHEALAQLNREGIVDPSFEHVCSYDALENTPSFSRSAVLPFALTGTVVLAITGGVAGAILGHMGLSGVPADTGALLGFVSLGALGGFASALGGIGAPDPGLDHAARHLKPGRMLMTFAINESRLAERAERVLEGFGALEVHRQLR